MVFNTYESGYTLQPYPQWAAVLHRPKFYSLSPYPQGHRTYWEVRSLAGSQLKAEQHFADLKAQDFQTCFEHPEIDRCVPVHIGVLKTATVDLHTYLKHP